MKFRPTSKAAASMLPFAKRLAAGMGRRKGIKHQFINGFLLRAVSDGQVVTVYVVEPGGMLGAGYGHQMRSTGINSAYPSPDLVAALLTWPCAPISEAGGAYGQTFMVKSFANHGGVRIGGPLTWGANHNTIPYAGAARSCPLPSAILMPAVAGEKEEAGNRSIIVQRMNAAMQWLPWQEGPGYVYRTPMALNAGHTGSPETLAYVEIAASALDLGDDFALRSGDAACLEWGALEGAVIANSTAEGEPPGLGSIMVSPGVDGEGAGIYPAGYALALGAPAQYQRTELGQAPRQAMRCVRYSVARLIDEQSGETSYQGSVLWEALLDGSTATGDLAPSTPPAATQATPAEASVSTDWQDLWIMENPLIWSDRAGEVDGHAAPGETILGVASVLLRRFRSTLRQAHEIAPKRADYPGTTQAITIGAESVLMSYFDRHLVRFKIDPATGSVSYESLYKFVNCFSVKPNSIGSFRTGVFDPGESPFRPFRNGAELLALQSHDTDVLTGYEFTPLVGFTVVTPADAGELRESFIACSKIGTLYEVLPAGQDNAAHPVLQGTDGAPIKDPWVQNGTVQMVGHVRLLDFIRPYPGNPQSPPYRAEKRNPTKTELADAIKLVVVGESGEPVEMDTGDYYPDFGPRALAQARWDGIYYDGNTNYQPDWSDRGSPVCHYAPGIIAVVVIPKAQHPEPRPHWPWPQPAPSPQVPNPTSHSLYYNAFGGPVHYENWTELEDAHDAWKAAADAARTIPPEPDTPPPQPQARHIALCNIRTGALLAVSPAFHTSTALQDTPKSPHRGAAYALSCIELGEVDTDGVLVRHAGLLISVHEPVRKVSPNGGEDTSELMITWDFCATVGSLGENSFAAPAYYLGTPLKPAKIGVSTGNPAIKGKLATPP